MSTIEQTLLRLQQSAFRAKFHLSEKDRQYIMGKGMETIQHHAADFIRMRLAPAIIPNDGKQTPMRGHPVFIAQHACACCCRSCLNKWYHVPIGRELTEDGWEFLFLGANIDAVETAKHFGISEDRAVNYHSDSVGTRLNYEVVSCAITSMRSGAPMSADWKAPIEADYKTRKGEKD